MLAINISRSRANEAFGKIWSFAEMEIRGCPRKSGLLDEIRNEGAHAEIEQIDQMPRQNLEAVMAHKVEGWD